MTRTDDEPVFIAEFADRAAAEAAWTRLTAADIAGAVITDNPPWGRLIYRVQVARSDAAAALRVLGSADS